MINVLKINRGLIPLEDTHTTAHFVCECHLFTRNRTLFEGVHRLNDVNICVLLNTESFNDRSTCFKKVFLCGSTIEPHSDVKIRTIQLAF